MHLILLTTLHLCEYVYTCMCWMYVCMRHSRLINMLNCVFPFPEEKCIQLCYVFLHCLPSSTTIQVYKLARILKLAYQHLWLCLSVTWSSPCTSKRPVESFPLTRTDKSLLATKDKCTLEEKWNLLYDSIKSHDIIFHSDSSKSNSTEYKI